MEEFKLAVNVDFDKKKVIECFGYTEEEFNKDLFTVIGKLTKDKKEFDRVSIVFKKIPEILPNANQFLGVCCALGFSSMLDSIMEEVQDE